MSYERRPRLSFEALHNFMGPVDALNGYVAQDARMKALEHHCGVGRRSLIRWRHEGVPLARADQIAVSLGAHPVDIWPEWYEVSA